MYKDYVKIKFTKEVQYLENKQSVFEMKKVFGINKLKGNKYV